MTQYRFKIGHDEINTRELELMLYSNDINHIIMFINNSIDNTQILLDAILGELDKQEIKTYNR